MSIEYDKPFLSIAQQIELLKRRGMGVANGTDAEKYLRHAGYYRLSSYWHTFRKIGKDGKRIDNFADGTDFSSVTQLYEFDKNLRSLLLSALRAIEISVRVAVAHHLGEKDIFAHENPLMLNRNFTTKEGTRRGKTWYQSWLEKYQHLLTRNEQEDFVREFILKYGNKIPIWVAIEIWDFGLLSKFFWGMKFNDQEAVAKLYGVSEPNVFASWLRTFNYIRNVCAHHSRLWNRNIIEQPKLPARYEIPDLDHLLLQRASGSRIYATLAITAYTLRAMDTAGQHLYLGAVKTLLNDFPASNGANLSMMGVPENWKSLPLWNSAVPPA